MMTFTEAKAYLEDFRKAKFEEQQKAIWTKYYGQQRTNNTEPCTDSSPIATVGRFESLVVAESEMEDSALENFNKWVSQGNK